MRLPEFRTIPMWLTMLLSLFEVSAVSQTAKQFAGSGDAAMRSGNYFQAAQFYLEASKRQEGRYDYVYKYADALREFNSHEKAYEAYTRVRRKSGIKSFPLVEFHMGMVKKELGDYDKAIFHLDNFLKRYKTEDYYRTKATHELKSCAFAKELSGEKADKKIKLEHESDEVNTFFTEFSSGALSDKEFFYSSIRENAGKEQKPKYFSRIYTYTMDDRGLAEYDSNFLFGINQQDKHIGNASLSQDGQSLYYTECEKPKFERLRCDIYRVKRTSIGWEASGEKLSINDDKASSTHPWAGRLPDGSEILFFASDREGGKGKMDIWYATKGSDGSWSRPKNAGPTINSIDNEVSPYLHPVSGHLYFSSDWHFGLGGYDVFRSKIYEGMEFSEPENLGKPFNSPLDDYYYREDPERAMGFLTSNRKGSMYIKGEGCCNDLYTFTPDELPIAVDTPEADTPEITVVDSLTIVMVDTPVTPPVIEPEPVPTPEPTPEPEPTPIPTPKPKYEDYFENFDKVTLYFDNDQPNPRTNSDTTLLNYKQTYEEYISQRVRYMSEYSKGLPPAKQKLAREQINKLFDEHIDDGFYKLISFFGNLKRALLDGRRVKVTLKGYCSPLAVNDYNVNLSERRTACLNNYILGYRDAYFMDYIENGQLKIIREPYGEEFAQTSISDDVGNLKESIYSPEAALERRVEIISAKLE